MRFVLPVALILLVPGCFSAEKAALQETPLESTSLDATNASEPPALPRVTPDPPTRPTATPAAPGGNATAPEEAGTAEGNGTAALPGDGGNGGPGNGTAPGDPDAAEDLGDEGNGPGNNTTATAPEEEEEEGSNVTAPGGATPGNNGTAPGGNETAPDGNGTSPAPVQGPPAAPNATANHTASLTVGQAHLLGSPSLNCIGIGGNLTTTRVLGGNATLTWSSGSFGPRNLELAYRVANATQPRTVQGASPLVLELTPSNLTADGRAPVIFVRLPGGAGGTTVQQQQVTLHLVVTYAGAEPIFERRTCT